MRRLVFLALLALMVAGIPAGASTFLVMNQGELIRDSAAVVEGEVLQVHSFWTRSGRIIVTEAIVKVSDPILGEAASAVVVRTFGGTVEGFTVEAHGFPTFRKGERLLLFLEAERDGAHKVAGYQPGQYRGVRDKHGVEGAGAALGGRASLVTRDGRQAARPKALPLSLLKDQIRTEARRLGRAPQRSGGGDQDLTRSKRRH